MKFFNTAILLFASSCRAIAMEGNSKEEVDTGSISVTRHSQEVVKSSKDNLSRFYAKKFAFSEPCLDVIALSNAVVRQEVSAEQFQELLENEIKTGNEKAEEKLYQFLTKEILGINIIDEKKASALLEKGMREEHTWAYWAQAQREPLDKGLTKWHYLACNREHAPSTKLVEEKSGYTSQLAKKFIEDVEREKNQRKRQNLIKLYQFKWSNLFYAQPFFDVYSLLQEKGNKPSRYVDEILFLKNAADLSHPKAFSEYIKILLAQGEKEEFLHYLPQFIKIQNSAAIYESGVILMNGFKSHPADEKKALNLFMIASNLGHINAMGNAACLLGFEEQPPDKARALQMFQCAAELGDSGAKKFVKALEDPCKNFLDLMPPPSSKVPLEVQESMFRVACAFFNGADDVPEDKSKALQSFLWLAQSGNVKAMLCAAALLMTGFEGQPIDKKSALDLVLKAAKKGNAEAMGCAGCLLLEGDKDIPIDKPRGLELLRQASNLGDPLSMYNAGLYLIKFNSLQQRKLKQANKLFMCSAQLNYTPSMIMLALFYLQKKEDEKAIHKAIFWLEKANSLGDLLAAKYLNLSKKYQEVTNEESSKEEICELEQLIEETQEPKQQIEFQKPFFKKEIVEESIFLPPEELTPEDFIIEETLEKEGQKEHERQRSINNPKYIREQLKRVYLLKQESDNLQALDSRSLTKESQEIVDKIRNKEQKDIDKHDLRKLFDDPYFCGQAIIHKTKSGICVFAHNRKTNEHYSTGTHKKHTKNYKGTYHRNFIFDLRKLLDMLGVK